MKNEPEHLDLYQKVSKKSSRDNSGLYIKELGVRSEAKKRELNNGWRKLRGCFPIK
jgi:hypothetical protein